jgi:uncharacterized protein YdhG (YjbR/CyaY superfamily)
MKSLSSEVDEYISKAPKSAQHKLSEVRRAILEAAPEAKESISYRIPFYSYKGSLAWFGYFPTHVGLYIRPPIVEQYKRALAGYKTTKSAVHLSLDEKTPVRLIKTLVRARVKINEAESRKVS